MTIYAAADVVIINAETTFQVRSRKIEERHVVGVDETMNEVRTHLNVYQTARKTIREDMTAVATALGALLERKRESTEEVLDLGLMTWVYLTAPQRLQQQ
jgi:hypothetical protein